ncbi:type II secretion system protein GspD [Synechococcus sp. CS-1331]|uniref:type II secretion system protein GspD n=1 Tax=Synechococcus sp. CS-1331 TaxID=2847973 RepID=UPI00223B1A62|nr:secretin N-terminal domain-containing protein [Synechococcus sp. CS-1331]
MVATTPLLLPANQVLAQARRPAQAANPGLQEAIGGLQLKVRRLPDAVELVLEQAGLGASLTQQPLADRWQGDLRTDRPRALKVGPQSLALPAEGFERISFEGSGENFRLTVTPVAGRPLGSPVISSDGRDLVVSFPAQPNVLSQTARPNLRQPTPVPIESFVPPLRPRAVAPPLGDMAVGTMTMRSPGYLQVKGPNITLTFRNAPVRDALMAVARVGGYGFVYLSESLTEEGRKDYLSIEEVKSRYKEFATNSGNNFERGPDNILTLKENPRAITVSFANESFSGAVNAILAAGGLQGRLQGRTIFAGPNLLALSTYGPQLSKVYRLNQASAKDAAQYLASLGARMSIPQSITNVQRTGNLIDPAGSPGGDRSTFSATNTSTSRSIEIQQFGGKIGPLLGLTGTIDSRLSTITLIGEPSTVAIAETYLRQIDLRQRQVALSLKILDVNLDNDSTMSNSFAIRWGNNFIVNDNGQLLGAFGNNLPPTYNPLTGSFSDPQQNPGSAYPKNEFYDFLRAQIVSSNTKLLASPTLILQDNPSELRVDNQSNGGSATKGNEEDDKKAALDDYNIDSPIGRRRANEGVVRVGTNVIYKYDVLSSANSAVGSNIITCTPSLATAGLVLGARIEKIDDNGFVTFALSPSVSAVTDREAVPGCGSIDILSIRRLDTGALRVRDGQTLIMTGVISDFDRAEVRKWPILGDIPFIGSLFRSSGNVRQKRELVIMVTPKIIYDEMGGAYGYGFRPDTEEARRMIYGSPGQ